MEKLLMSDEFRFDENDNGGHIKNTNVRPIVRDTDYGFRSPVRDFSETQSVFELKNVPRLDENAAQELANDIWTSSPKSLYELNTFRINKKTTLTIDPTNYDVVFTGNKYKYNELNLLNEMVKYVDKTYSEHYSSGRAKTQALDSIIDSGHGFSFCIGNVLKYAQRVEKKGTREDGRKDLQKIIHYAILALNEYDQETLQMNEAK
jgi:hypothetical protein